MGGENHAVDIFSVDALCNVTNHITKSIDLDKKYHIFFYDFILIKPNISHNFLSEMASK